MTRLFRLRYWFRTKVKEVQAFIHRGRHGWAPQDTWNLDVYFARVMAGALRHQVANGHGYPPDFPHNEGETGAEAWDQARLHWAGVLQSYADNAYHFPAEVPDVEPVLSEMGQWWPHLWD